MMYGTAAESGKERKEAEAVGAKFEWPCFSKAVMERRAGAYYR